MTIWLASGNINKKKELAAILGGQVLIPADAGLDFDPEESGSTFYENALIKARALHSLLEQGRPPLFKSGDPIIADDSGICVDALDGRPGIYSARYAGVGSGKCSSNNQSTTRKHHHNSNNNPTPYSPLPTPHKKLKDHERNALLLGEMDGKSPRTARFVCAMALYFSPDRFFVAQETLEGEIVGGLQAARGTGGGRGTRGFGYDPILYIPGLGRTVAELSEEEKNAVSHRAKAGKIIAAIIGACC